MIAQMANFEKELFKAWYSKKTESDNNNKTLRQ